MEQICLIDYGAGNLRSVYNALMRVIKDHGLNVRINVSDNPQILKSADKIILPGVGAFQACMEGLKGRAGLIEALQDQLHIKKSPFLGICVGMQMMAQIGQEFGTHKGLGVIKDSVVHGFDTDPKFDILNLKIPHMGWNKITKIHDHPVLKDIKTGDYFYFVHSYKMDLPVHYIALMCDYGVSFPAFIHHEHIVGAQFHPEKSQKAGLNLLRNFLQWKI